MALFKFRKGGDEQNAAAPAPESVEVMRRRAKNRLIGATLLVLVGVIGFPLLVDRQPRPVAADLPIDIPDKNHVQPLSLPAEPASGVTAATAATAGAVVEDSSVAAAPSAAGKVAPPPPVVRPEPKSSPKPAAKSEVKSEAKPEVKSPSKSDAKPDTKADSKPDTKTADGRYVVQVGSFADEAHAHGARAKLERAGLKNYTQVVETKDGKRIRVRAGPYASKAEAERVVERIRKMDLQAALLVL